MNHSVENNEAGMAGDLLKKREKLFSGHDPADAPSVLATYAHYIDEYIRNSFETSNIGPRMNIIKHPYAIIALGGYGRAEQCYHSDVDLLILFQGRVPPEADELIREIIYPLWNIRMEVGHATRSVDECIKIAQEEYEVFTSILDARFICGISSVYTRLMDQIEHRIIQGCSGKVVKWLVERNHQRHRDFGDSTFLLEPNLKEGNGGLRDYHTMRWVAGIRFGLKEIRDLEYLGCLSHAEYNDMSAALAFIWSVRNRLHQIARRKCDQLYFEYQDRLARSMGFLPEKGQSAVERFLSELHAAMTHIKEQLLLFLYELGYEHPGKWKHNIRKVKQIRGIHLAEGRLYFDSPEIILDDPLLLIRIFDVSAELKIPLGREALRLIREFGYLADGQSLENPVARNMFENILTSPAPAFNVLEQMLNAGFLVRLIPEYAPVVDRIQYDAYHLYPVDRHMLRTVHILKSFGTSRDPCPDVLCGDLYRSLKRKKPLLLAALLHDLGKGLPEKKHSNAGAAIVRVVLGRMGYPQREIDTVSFLVEHHLLLVKTATRRDINDEETAIMCARRVQNQSRLKMLYLLTIADSVATGPKAWNDWTAALLRDLFLKVANILESGELASSAAIRIIEEKMEYVGNMPDAAVNGSGIKRLLAEMSPRYLLYTGPGEILSHIHLYRRLGDAPFVWEVHPDPELNTRTVVICAKDRPGLFSRIAGVFTLNSINILDAQVYTWRNHIALDIFKVEPPPDRIFEAERWLKAEKNLHDALSGNLDLTEALSKKVLPGRRVEAHVSTRPNRVVVDNNMSSFFTIIEVFAYDFPGLLHRIADAISRCGLNIRVAKIATKLDQVVDVFYVRDESDEKIIDPDQVDNIKKEVLSVIPPAGGNIETGSEFHTSQE